VTGPTRKPSLAEAGALESTRQQVIEDLRELIVALDRRVPRLERTGEVEIARDAAALRNGALDRIAQLERSGS
jgi:hypothetical protein